MNKQQIYMEKMLAFLLLVFAIGLMLGESIRDRLYGKIIAENEQVSDQDYIPASPNRKKGKKWKRYSGLFILLKQKWVISRAEQRAISNAAFAAFVAIVQHPVLTYV